MLSDRQKVYRHYRCRAWHVSSRQRTRIPRTLPPSPQSPLHMSCTSQFPRHTKLRWPCQHKLKCHFSKQSPDQFDALYIRLHVSVAASVHVKVPCQQAAFEASHDGFRPFCTLQLPRQQGSEHYVIMLPPIHSLRLRTRQSMNTGSQ